MKLQQYTCNHPSLRRPYFQGGVVEASIEVWVVGLPTTLISFPPVAMDANSNNLRIVESFDVEPFTVDVIEFSPEAEDDERGVFVSVSTYDSKEAPECLFTLCPSHAREIASAVKEAADFANRHAGKRGWKLFQKI